MTHTLTADRDAAMRAYYEQRAGEYDQWYLRRGRFADRADPERWYAEVGALRGRVATFGDGRLLEVAAGTGWWTQHLARRATVTAIDYAPAMLGQLGARLRQQSLEAGRVRADAYRLPFAAGSFDCCFFGFWLSHVPYQRLGEFLAELRRVVRPGVEYFHERILNDGTHHEVLKILHTPATIAAALAPLGRVVETWGTGAFFTGAIVAVE